MASALRQGGGGYCTAMSQEQPYPAEGPDDPAYTGEGQVSETQRLDQGDAGTPISPGDSTAGYPESEAGEPDTRGAGPDAVPPANERDNEMKPEEGRLGESFEDESF